MEQDNIKASNSPLNVQVGGNHYKAGAYQPIVLAEKLNMNPSCFSILKYVYRHKNKNKKQDLDKALHYCDLLESLGNKWYGYFCNGIGGYSMPSAEFSKFLLENDQLDSNQTKAILAIEQKDLSMLRIYIRKEIVECYK